MKTKPLLLAGLLACCSSASATLLDRGPDMVYDTVLNITWTRQAGDGVLEPWFDSVASVNDLVFAGFNDWRLPWASVNAQAGPVTSVVDCGSATETACRDNEMGYMFYYNLGGTSGQSKTGTQTAVDGQVLTGINEFYWSGTEIDSTFVWIFDFDSGGQFGGHRALDYWAWAVRPGDVAAIPEPGSLLLIGLGLAALGWSRRKKA